MSKSELFTADFWQRTFSQAVHSAAAGALTPLAGQVAGEIHSVPWQACALGAGVGALLSVLVSLVSIPVPGTVPASFVPTKLVEGQPKDGDA